MSYVTIMEGRALLKYASVLEGKIHLDVPISVKDSDLYILFGEQAFDNPVLMDASRLGSSINELLGLGAIPEKEYWLQFFHAREWLKKVELGAVVSRDPNDWLVHCSEKGGLNHILWCLAHKRDIVSQFYWAHDMVGMQCEDLNGELLDLLPKVQSAHSGSKQGVSYSRGYDERWSVGNRRQVYYPYTWNWEVKFPAYPLHRRGKQPRGKSLADKRKGNLDSRYIKEYS